uniref:Uncharacterized protein n=1 Tax=Angiostrongylus cantonensis TaxID=6313 RepID=A0A0K0DKP7_ANGCA
MPRVSLAIPLRTSRAAPPRSLSIAGLSGWSSGYHPIGGSPLNDRTPLLDPPDEPPPSYEFVCEDYSKVIISDPSDFFGSALKSVYREGAAVLLQLYSTTNVCTFIRPSASVHFFTSELDLSVEFKGAENTKRIL